MSDLSKRVRGIYDTVSDRGLYVNSNLDVILGDFEEVLLTHGGQTSIKVPSKEAYNSVLLFSTLVGLMNNGTLLMMGPPGSGKTTSSEIMGHFIYNIPVKDILASEIQGHPEQTEEKMVARFHTGKLVQQGVEEVIPREFFNSPVKIVDEINRLTPSKLSILQRVIDTGRAKYGDKVLEAMPGPIYATANYKDGGNFQMTPSFIDRFDLAVMVSEPNPLDYAIITERGDEKLGQSIDNLLEIPQNLIISSKDMLKVRQEISEMKYSLDAKNFAYFFASQINFCDGASSDVSRKTKGNAWQKDVDQLMAQEHYPPDHITNLTKTGITARTMKAIERYSRALSWFRGSSEVTMEDVNTVIPYTIWHKIEPSKSSFDVDQKYINDRINLAKHLVDKASQSYSAAKPLFKVYATGAQAFTQYQNKDISKAKAQKILMNSIKEIAGHDDPIKYAFAVQLVSMHYAVSRG